MRYHRHARDLFPGAYRVEVEADRARRRRRQRDDLRRITRVANGTDDLDDDEHVIANVDHRHGAAQQL